jgi:uncharacterized membrane protein
VTREVTGAQQLKHFLLLVIFIFGISSFLHNFLLQMVFIISNVKNSSNNYSTKCKDLLFATLIYVFLLCGVLRVRVCEIVESYLA